MARTDEGTLSSCGINRMGPTSLPRNRLRCDAHTGLGLPESGVPSASASFGSSWEAPRRRVASPTAGAVFGALHGGRLRQAAGRAPLRGRDAVRAPAAGGRPPALRSGEAAAVKEAPLPLRLLPPPTGCRKRVNGERVVGGGKGGQGARSQSGAASGGRWRRWRGVGSEVVQGSRRRRLRGSKGKLKLQSGLLVRGPRSPHPGRWTSTESSKR